MYSQTLPMGQPYCRGTPSKHTKNWRQSSLWAWREKAPTTEATPGAGHAMPASSFSSAGKG